ncbi:hypothetical protein ACHAXS_005546 [Conticribra weissflogii]
MTTDSKEISSHDVCVAIEKAETTQTCDGDTLKICIDSPTGYSENPSIPLSGVALPSAQSPRRHISSLTRNGSRLIQLRSRHISSLMRNGSRFIQLQRNMNKKYVWSLCLVCVGVAIGLLAASLKKVPSTEMGVQISVLGSKRRWILSCIISISQYDVHKKQLEDAIKSGGLFVGPPGFRFIKFPSTFITVNFQDRTCVSNDGLLVTFSVTFEYQMTAVNLNTVILKYRNFDKWASIVEQAGLSAIHHTCSEFSVTEFQIKRGIIQSKMEENLRLKLEGDESTSEEGVNAVAVSLQLTYVHLPEEYNEAVASKQAAEEDITVAIAQRNQEITKAKTNLLKAEEEAHKIKDSAINEAEVLITEASLKAEETLYSFEKEADALMEVKDKLNLTSEGLLAYLTNRLLAEADHLKVTAGEPARLSRRDEL